MSDLQERIAEIDRVWSDQVQYSNRQRQQRLQQSLAAFLQDRGRTIMGLRERLHAMGNELERMREQSGTGGAENTTRGGDVDVTAELDALWLVINELGVRLACAWNLRIGTREDIQQQLRKKGLRDETVQKLCSAPGFWEEVGEQLLPRRSARRHVSGCEVTQDASGSSKSPSSNTPR